MRAAVCALLPLLPLLPLPLPLPLLAGCLSWSLPEAAPLENDAAPGEGAARALLRSFHEWRSAAFPVEVSLEGRHEHDGTFGGLTPADCARRIRALEYYAGEIDSVDLASTSPATARALAALRARIDELIRRQEELREGGLGFDPETVAAGLRVLMDPATPGRAHALASRLNEAAPVLKRVPDAERLLVEIEAWFEALPDEELRELGRRAVRRAR
jgi:hypothetical protein